MKRVFGLILILAFASAGAPDGFAQSRRARRAEPPPPQGERDGQSGRRDEARNEAKDESKDKAEGDVRAGEGKPKPLTGSEVSVRAVVKSKPDPVYPREARRYQVQGAVKLRIILGADGKVREQMDVLEGLPYGVTEEAIKAARRIEFEPARKDGRPVSQYVTVIYNFRIH
jgi:protein TonB